MGRETLGGHCSPSGFQPEREIMGSQTWRKVIWTFSGTGGWMGQRALYTGEGYRRGGGTHKVPGKPMGGTMFLQRGEGIPNEREHLQEYSVPGSKERVGLLTCAPMAACWAGPVSPPLKCLHPGGLLRGSGNNHKLSLLAFPGFSLGDRNLCDFPMRAFAGARNEKEHRAEASHLWPPVAFFSTSRERGQVSGIMVPA